MSDQEKMISLYDGKVTIKFQPSGHSYWLMTKPQKRLTGVTTHISVLDKPALIPWAVGLAVDYIEENMESLRHGDMDASEILRLAKEQANTQRDISAEIGSAIHAWVEAHCKGLEPDMPTDEKVLQGVASFLDWVAEYKVTFLWNEQIVYSKKHGYVGTADFAITIGTPGHKGKKYLGDMKTGNGIYAEVKQQTAAYLKALEEESGDHYDGRWVLRISKETEEQYMEKMNKKLEKGKIKSIPAFKVFEAVFLDNDLESLNRDFSAYLASKQEYEWKAIAEKELKEARG